MQRLAITGGRVLDPEAGTESVRDLVVENGCLTDEAPRGDETVVICRVRGVDGKCHTLKIHLCLGFSFELVQVQLVLQDP